LKGDRCSSPKCALVKHPFPPGPPKKRRAGNFSEYAKELKEKQKLQKHYGLREKQFRNYVKNVLQMRGHVEDATLLLIDQLERRLDNVVFKLGLAKSRAEARQLVGHGYFLVNGKPSKTPSLQAKKGMTISVKPSKKNKTFIKNIEAILKNYQVPDWLVLDKDKLEAKVSGDPLTSEPAAMVDISSIFEFYSR
jgi:small subunit ribosomal protein S4